MSQSAFSRRRFLRGIGVGLALPFLDAMQPAHTATGAPPRRMVAICTGLGLNTENLFPTQAGRDYSPSPYLQILKDYRNDMTVISGLSHPLVDGGHSSEACFLTGAPHPGQPTFRNHISIDQVALEQTSPDTRFPCLVLSTASTIGMSFTRSGVMIPADSSPAAVFRRLFIEGNRQETELQMARIREGESVMDRVQDETLRLQKSLGPRDRERLEDYFTAVREVEKRLQQSEAWVKKPKPKVSAPPPQDIYNSADIIGRSRLLMDLISLALQTDSTRFVTVSIYGLSVVPPIKGVNQDWHNLSHHGKDPDKLAQLKLIEMELMKVYGGLLGKLKNTREMDGSLLDNTMVLFGSNLGNGSSHDTHNMPILLAGGKFRHGQHLAFDPTKNPPLCNLYVSMLQQLGVQTDRFSSGRSTLRGLEMTS